MVAGRHSRVWSQVLLGATWSSWDPKMQKVGGPPDSAFLGVLGDCDTVAMWTTLGAGWPASQAHEPLTGPEQRLTQTHVSCRSSGGAGRKHCKRGQRCRGVRAGPGLALRPLGGLSGHGELSAPLWAHLRVGSTQADSALPCRAGSTPLSSWTTPVAPPSRCAAARTSAPSSLECELPLRALPFAQ